MQTENFNANFDIDISIDSLSFGNLEIFENFNFTLSAGKWTSVLGKSGVGKSTLLRGITGELESKTNFSITCSDNAPLKGRIAYMGQQDLLLPWLTVFENVTLGMRLRKERDPVSIANAYELIDKVGLRKYCKEIPENLSGGMKQRVALARTLLENKSLVIMDEPFSALDIVTKLEIQDLFAEMLRDKTVLFVTHDPLEALRLGNYIYLMRGSPAYLEKISELSGAVPRDIKNNELHSFHGELLLAMRED